MPQRQERFSGARTPGPDFTGFNRNATDRSGMCSFLWVQPEQLAMSCLLRALLLSCQLNIILQLHREKRWSVESFCMWAFDQTARISEYTKREPGGQDHCVRVDDLTFSLNVGDSVRGSGLYPLLVGDTPEGAVKLEDILECHVQAVTTKARTESRRS